jgi:uncharacterized membrane protein
MEEIAKNITICISHALEIISAAVIGFAILRFIYQYFRQLFQKQAGRDFTGKSPGQLRLGFGTAVSISLELLLGADVLATAVAPSWDDIGKLAAIATLRTALNYFLEKELRHSKSYA